MDGTAVEALAGLMKKPQAVDGLHYWPSGWSVQDPAALVKAGPRMEPLVVSTLGSLRDYLTANRDALTLASVQVLVDSPMKIRVFGPPNGRDRTREYFATAQCLDMTDGFIGKYMSLEDFILGLQVRFVDAEQRAALLTLLSSVKNENVKTATDDGFSQVVQARAGVVLMGEVAVPNPVALTAYRTFRDIPQPTTIYVLRLQQGKEGGLPTVGLFEADGGAWRLTTVARIKDWLMNELPAIVAVLA